MAWKSVPVLILLVLTPLVLFAQNGPSTARPASADQFAGNYKGSVKGPDGDIALTLEIKSAQGKITGRLVTPQGEQPVTGEVVDGKLIIKLGSEAASSVLVVQLRDDKVVGEWKTGVAGRAVEFKRVPATTEPPAAEVKESAPDPSAAELLSGEWDAAADAQGQAFPFTLTLKVEGDKVTGSSSSSLGNSTISSGSWKDGKLAVVLDAANGPIALIATMVDGKLVGDYDFAGQLQGKWVAVKKKP
jgi:hypothetical protein